MGSGFNSHAKSGRFVKSRGKSGGGTEGKGRLKGTLRGNEILLQDDEENMKELEVS